MDPRLRDAARSGNIDVLYAIIHEDPYILERLEQVPFVDTPLHMAASEGHINFVMEMMNLKPSFARKLNHDGWSPTHLAMKNEQTKLVISLLESDKDLAGVKGREGMTPLHLVSKTGDLSLLFEFLEACPECIEDVTVNNDTALQLALKNNQIETFNLLMGWLHNSSKLCAQGLGNIIINWRDNKDNTLLHIAANKNQREALRQLLSSRFLWDAIKVKNSDGLTALEIIKPGKVQNQEIKSETKYRKYLKPKFQRFGRSPSVELRRWKKSLSIEMINVMLVVTALVITATYQSSLNPPGGVFLPDSSPPTSNTTHPVVHSSGNFFTNLFYVKPNSPGTPVIDSSRFVLFWLMNSFTLWITIGITAKLLIPSFVLLLTPLSCLGACYFCSIIVSSPSSTWAIINTIVMFLMLLLPLGLLSPVYKLRYKINRDKTNFLQVLNNHNRATHIQA